MTPRWGFSRFGVGGYKDVASELKNGTFGRRSDSRRDSTAVGLG